MGARRDWIFLDLVGESVVVREPMRGQGVRRGTVADSVADQVEDAVKWVTVKWVTVADQVEDAVSSGDRE